jgi:hypothetical protein
MTQHETFLYLLGNQNKTHFAKKHKVSRRAIYNWINGENISNCTLTEIAKTEGYKIINEIKLEKL